MPRGRTVPIKPVCDWESEVPVLMDMTFLCRILGVTAPTVYKMEKNQGLPRIMINGAPRYRKESILKWLQSQERTSP